ncbi:MAG: phosphoglycolate phosphatase [Gammaproteobacteria bacterium]|nr:MAG: phosphoglycolate phosphatase [Gammaproteobacteria bacterium]
MPRPPELVLLDLDGTLVDSVPDLADCVNEALRAAGLPPRAEGEVRRWVGNGVVRLLHRALTGTMEGEAPAGLFEPARERFWACYRERYACRSRPFPGVQEGLAALHRAGIPLGCVTNKPAAFTRPLLEALGLAPWLQVVVAGDETAHQKPHPEPLLEAARRAGARPGASLLVGDSVNDVEAARAAGMPVVAVSYGYNHGRDIREARPDAVVDSLAELPALLGLAGPAGAASASP